MTIIYSSSPGSASKTFKKILEITLNCKAKVLAADGAIGHLQISIHAKDKIFKRIKLNFLRKETKLISGHIFPTNTNMEVLNKYYNIEHIIISYRNIFDQLNYYYKWQKYNFRCPLSFLEDKNFHKKEKFSSNNYNIDLNLILVLNFYKHWFYLIQNNLIKNFTLFSFDEIVSQNKDYKKKFLSIFENKGGYQIKFDTKIKENIFKEERFEIHPRHHKIIEDFISSHKEIDFSLITN